MPCCGLGRPVDLLGTPVPDHRAVNSEILLLVPAFISTSVLWRYGKLRKWDILPFQYMRTRGLQSVNDPPCPTVAPR
jgi:hypothetical protein